MRGYAKNAITLFPLAAAKNSIVGRGGYNRNFNYDRDMNADCKECNNKTVST